MGSPTDFVYQTPESAWTLKLIPGFTLKDYKKLAGNNNDCENCGQHVWRYGQTGMCFLCTTGESDASGDYEIGAPYG